MLFFFFLKNNAFFVCVCVCVENGIFFLLGLKPGQRKVLFTCFKRNDKREVKVAQLAGSVAEMSAYHHGEVSVNSRKVVRICSLCKMFTVLKFQIFWLNLLITDLILKSLSQAVCSLKRKYISIPSKSLCIVVLPSSLWVMEKC